MKIRRRRRGSGRQGSVAASAFVIASASLGSRLLGVFRDRILAGQFGAGNVLDVYYAAFRIPDLIYNLIIVGALSAGFIPVFIAERQRSQAVSGRRATHWYLVNAVLSIAFAGLVLISVVLAFTVTRLTPWITPGFDAAKMAAVAKLSRIMFFSPVLLGVSAIIGGVLQSHRRFFAFALAPISYNIGIILGALFLVPWWGVSGLAWGVVLGAGLHLAVQFPSALRLGWRMQWVWDLRFPGVREIGRLMVPRTLALGVTQLNLLILTVLASYLTTGSVAVFNLATNLGMVPVALVGISYALAVFPVMAETAGHHDELFRETFARTVRQILFFVVPATILMILLRAQIVRAILGSGAFDWTDTVLTFEALRWLAVSLFAQAIIPLLVRAFYAHHDTRTPLIVGAIGDLTTLGVSFWLIDGYGVIGLAMAFSARAVVQALGLWVTLHWRIGDLGERGVVRALRQFTVAGVALAFVAQGIKIGLGQLTGTKTLAAIVLQGGVAAVSGLVAYGLVLLLWGSAELFELWAAVRQRMAPVPVTEGLDETEGM